MKKICMLLFLFLIPICIVKADDSSYVTAIDNPGYDVSVDRYGTTGTLNITITGITTPVPSGTSYYYIFTDSATAPTIPTNDQGCSVSNGEGAFDWMVYNAGTNYNSFGNYWFLLKGYNYAWILTKTFENGYYYCKYINAPITVEKGDFPSLGQKYSTFVNFENYSTNSPLYNMANYPPSQNYTETATYLANKGIVSDYKRYIKIGKVTDSELLSNLIYNKSGALQDLFDYAKTSTGIEYSYIAEGASTFTVTGDLDSLDRTPGVYYYIYTYYKDSAIREESADVVFTQVNETGNIAAFTDYLTYDADDYDSGDRDSSSNSSSNTVTNPGTGLKDYFIIGLVIISLGFVLIEKFKRKYSN